MLLNIHHASVFNFSAPMRYVVQSHRLMPASFEGQRILDWNVEVENAEFSNYYVDGAGDQIRTMSCEGPLDSLTVTIRGSVELTDTKGVLRGYQETIPPLAYLRDTPFTKPDQAIKDLVDATLKTADGTSLDIAHKMSAAVTTAVAYKSGTTESNTTAAEALAQGQGVCQDHAHVLIAMARSAELPARYVSGYLNTSADVNTEEASHAWAEIFIEGLGWIGFDASNECCPDENYVRLGSGLDALYAAPIRGMTIGTGVEELDVTVAVSARQQ